MKDPTGTLYAPVTIDETLCTGCGRCVTACNRDVLEMVKPAGDGRRTKPLAMVVNPAACVQCGMCVTACRHGAVSVSGGDDTTDTRPRQAENSRPGSRGFFTRGSHRRGHRRRFGRGKPDTRDER